MTTLPADVREELETLEPWEQQVAARTLVIGAMLEREGWQEWTELDWSYLGSGQLETDRVVLPAGRYQAYGICDDDCADLDLAVYGADGALIAEDTEVDALPIVEFTADRAGRFSIETRMYDCRTTTCLYGTSVWTAGSAAGEEELALSPEVREGLDAADRAIEAQESMRWLRRVQSDFPAVRNQYVALITELLEGNASSDEAFAAAMSWSSSIATSYLPFYVARHGRDMVEDLALLDRADLSPRQRRRVCKVGRALYASALDLPGPSRADLLRYLLSQ